MIWGPVLCFDMPRNGSMIEILISYTRGQRGLT